MKRTLEWLHKYLPYIPVLYFLIVLVYMLIATIYIKQIPEQDFTMSANQFERAFGHGMHELRFFDFGLLILSIFALLVWLIASLLGGIVYRGRFEFNPVSTSFALATVLGHFYMITVGLSWFFG